MSVSLPSLWIPNQFLEGGKPTRLTVRNWEMCSVPLVLGKCKQKPQLDPTSHLLQWPNNQIYQTIKRVGMNVEKLKMLYSASRSEEKVQLPWKTVWQFLKQFNIKLLCNFTPRYTSKKIENRCSHKNLHQKFHSSATQNDQKETIQMQNWRMDEQNGIWPYNGIPFSHKKEQGPDTDYNMDKPGKYYGKWKMQDTKSHIFMIPFIWNRTEEVDSGTER